MSWLSIIEQWPLVEYDFHASLNIEDITARLPHVSWSWFTNRIIGLLSSPTHLAQFFKHDDAEASNGE